MVVAVSMSVVDGAGSVVEVVVAAGVASTVVPVVPPEQAPATRARATSRAGSGGVRMVRRLRRDRAKEDRPCIIKG